MFELAQSRFFNTQGYINGQWVDADSGATFTVYNPATGAAIAEVADLGPAETRRAIEAAEQAMQQWRQLTAKQRADVLERWQQLLLENQRELACIMTLEQGKPLAEAMGEIAYGASYLKWFAEEAKRVYGDVLPAPMADRRSLVIKQPVGVVAAITPWNFPNAMLARKVAPALAVGCAMVAKPAAETPLSALALAQLGSEAGLPDGLFNVITSSEAAAIGQAMTDSETVRKLTFTGSTRIGKQLMRQCADTVKRSSMELGGNAPLIIFDDADLEKAVAGAMVSKFRNAGQTCICANRILVQEGIYPAFVERLSKEVAKLEVADGFSEGATQGPLITAQALAGVQQKVTQALEDGAELICGGAPHPAGEQFFQPTILSGVTDSMQVFRQEIFGPVAPLVRFSTEQQAIELANDTEYGLAAYFYSNDLARVWRVAEAIDYGMVGINEAAISADSIPFGGVKQSGQGREGSKYGLDDYLETKYLCLGGL